MYCRSRRPEEWRRSRPAIFIARMEHSGLGQGPRAAALCRKITSSGSPGVSAIPPLGKLTLSLFWAAACLPTKTSAFPPYFAADAKIAKVDIHAEELNRSRWVHHPFHADCSAFVHLLVAGLKDQNIKPWPVPGWISDALQPRRDTLKDVLGSLEGKLHPLTICQTVADTVGGRCCCRGGRRVSQQLDESDLPRPKGPADLTICTRWDRWGHAHRSRSARPRPPKSRPKKTGTAQRQVVLVTGDGSFGYYLTSLSEAVRAGLKLTVVVLNDSAWGSELNIQVHDKIGRPVNTRLGPQDFSLVARGFGCKGVRVNALDDFRSAFNDALTADVPSVIDCDIDVSDALIAHDKPDLITLGFQRTDA